MSTPRDVDIAIIGAGTAGMSAYRDAAKLTDRVLLIEGNAYGTTCARVGCMPSKMLIAAGEAAHAGSHAKRFGVSYTKPKINGKAVMKRLRDLRDRYVDGVKEAVEAWPEHHRVMANARFTGPDTLTLDPLDGSESFDVKAAQTIIATGATPVMPRPFTDISDDVITSDDVFDWTDLPKSVLIFGAGVIGVEIGQALHRLGVKVVLLGKSNSIAQLSDPAVRAIALDIFKDDMTFHPEHEMEFLKKTKTGVRCKWTAPTGDGTQTFEKVLVAVGRAPNVANLGLETTGIELNDRGVPVFDVNTGRCGDSHIYIAGDASNHVPLLHVAAHQGKIAGPNAANHPETHAASMHTGLSVTFTDPQIAVAGQSFKELTSAGVEFANGEIDWSDQGRATVMGINSGLTRVYGDIATGKLVGAEMVGPNAEHLAHLLAWSIECGATVTEILERPFYHPCLEEGLRTALRRLAYTMGEAKDKPVPRCLDCGPGG